MRRDQPGILFEGSLSYCFPRQDKLEHSNAIKEMKDEEIESAIAILKRNDGGSSGWERAPD